MSAKKKEKINFSVKSEFQDQLKAFAKTIPGYAHTGDGEWAIKGFIDVLENIYTISSDTKIISKILEIHLFPKILKFSKKIGYKLVLAEHQNHYPDISFVNSSDDSIRFAVDIKTTYRDPKNPRLCNGFTLGSHGKYFQDRKSTKNIRFPYASYAGHFCLEIIYDRIIGPSIDEAKSYTLNELQSITSVIGNFQVFVAEKWKLASDKSGSGNTANIGSIRLIDNIINEHGVFSQLGEEWFDDYWMNFKKITISDVQKGNKKSSNLQEFVEYRRGDKSRIVLQDHSAKKRR